MIIAQLLTLPAFKIPAAVSKAATGLEIQPYSKNVPMGANCWLSCRYAWPHTDTHNPNWRDKLFLTLAIESNHAVSDTKAVTPKAIAHSVMPGMLFVVDPNVLHWLVPRNDDGTVQRFICLQWELPRKEAKVKARELVCEYNGFWLSTEDRRYATWSPKTKPFTT